VTFLEQAKNSNHRYLHPIKENYDLNKAVFSIFIDCYYGLDLVKQSIQSILDQDYQNIELILIDNGAKEDVSKYLYSIYTDYENTAIIKFEENQFSWENVEIPTVICWNSAVFHSNGDILAHLSYDDVLSYDYASRMMRLFTENKNCVTAAPLPVAIDVNGKIDKEFSEILRKRNDRSKYTDGKKLSIDLIEGNPNNLFLAPGEIMAIKKSLLIKYGGYDTYNDLTQVLKFSIHGDSGFDPKAKIFWRSHESQLNKQATKKGIVWCGLLKETIKKSKIIEIWKELFTKDDMNKLNRFIVIQAKDSAADSVSRALLSSLTARNPALFFLTIKNISKQCPSLLFYSIGVSILQLLIIIKKKIKFD
jgi:glycosyltransferase involved in cell wall biosynthesis